jgi:hypothetical protein
MIEELFSDIKGKFVFNFMDDLVVYSPSLISMSAICGEFFSVYKKLALR